MISGKGLTYQYVSLRNLNCRWNFEKFLLDHNGKPMRRYDESLDPKDIIPDIDVLLRLLNPY